LRFFDHRQNKKLDAVKSLHSIQINFPDINLEAAILALFDFESIHQAETPFEIYLKNHNTLEIIKSILLSFNIYIRQSVLVSLLQIIQYFQIHSQSLSITLSPTFSDVCFWLLMIHHVL
jgi:hypothetical protein